MVGCIFVIRDTPIAILVSVSVANTELWASTEGVYWFLANQEAGGARCRLQRQQKDGQVSSNTLHGHHWRLLPRIDWVGVTIQSCLQEVYNAQTLEFVQLALNRSKKDKVAFFGCLLAVRLGNAEIRALLHTWHSRAFCACCIVDGFSIGIMSDIRKDTEHVRITLTSWILSRIYKLLSAKEKM